MAEPELAGTQIAKGKDAKAKALLQRLHAHSSGEEFVEKEYLEICDQIAAEKEQREPTWAEIARRPSWRKRILLTIGLQVFTQTTGVSEILVCPYISRPSKVDFFCRPPRSTAFNIVRLRVLSPS